MKNWIQRVGACFNVLLLSLFICTSPCVANENFFKNQSYVEKECFEESYFSNNSKKTTEDKVYIQADNIYLSQHQIFLNFEGDLIPIQHLLCDGNGFFTSIQDIQMGRGRQETWVCKKCAYENYVGIDSYGYCGHGRFDQNGK